LVIFALYDWLPIRQKAVVKDFPLCLPLHIGLLDSGSIFFASMFIYQFVIETII